MLEFGLTETFAIVVAIGFAISVPLTLFARMLFVHDARRRADMWGLDNGKRAYIERQVRMFMRLVALQFVVDLVLIVAFGWILYFGVTANGREFLDAVLPTFYWVLALSVARVLLHIPIRRIIRLVRQTT